jgi:hypothetical protein
MLQLIGCHEEVADWGSDCGSVKVYLGNTSDVQGCVVGGSAIRLQWAVQKWWCQCFNKGAAGPPSKQTILIFPAAPAQPKPTRPPQFGTWGINLCHLDLALIYSWLANAWHAGYRGRLETARDDAETNRPC